MKITNEIVEHNGKYYARVIVCRGERVVAGTLWRSIDGIYYEADPSAVEWSESILLYIPIKVPKGYPDGWSLLKDGDVVGDKTLTSDQYSCSNVNPYVKGEYSKICEQNPQWSSHVMFNPVKTPQNNYAEAEKSGIIEAWKSGKDIEYSVNGRDWELSSTPNFCLDVLCGRNSWRVSRYNC